MSVSRLHLKKVFQKANEHKWIQMVFLPFIWWENGPIPAFLRILTHKEFPSLEHFLTITHLSVRFIRYLEKTPQKDTYNAEWKISGIQYSPEEAKNGNMYIYFSEPLEFQIETPVQSDGTVKKITERKTAKWNYFDLRHKKHWLQFLWNPKVMKNPKITKKWNKVVLTHCYHHLNNMAMLFTMQMEIIWQIKPDLLQFKIMMFLKFKFAYFKLPVNPNQDVNNQPEYEEFQQSFRESGYSYDMIKDRIVKQVEIVFEE
mgnify:CR=1 FL=1